MNILVQSVCHAKKEKKKQHKMGLVSIEIEGNCQFIKSFVFCPSAVSIKNN